MNKLEFDSCRGEPRVASDSLIHQFTNSLIH